VEVRPARGQVRDALTEIKARAERGERALVTTLTKRMAEELSEFLRAEGVKARYLHSEIQTIERVEILRSLREGEFDCVVGVNLLREGLDLPEVTLVAILDADKEGFLRSAVSLIQTIGRAARNADARVLLYADRMTDSLESAIGETSRRRARQVLHNEEHGITPITISKAIKSGIEQMVKAPKKRRGARVSFREEELPRTARVSSLLAEMKEAARSLDFERAAELRDLISGLSEGELLEEGDEVETIEEEIGS
jgi:excinuclease ABC subunit B